MKKAILLSLLILFTNLGLMAQRSTWSKHLQNSSYTLRFDPTGLSNIDVYNNGSRVTDYNTKLSLVYGQIDYALAAWSAATDYTVSMSRVTSGGDFLMIIDGLEPIETLGNAGSPIAINWYWGFTINGTQGDRIHFYSAVIHEIGHLFIGYVHCTEDNGSVMWAPSTHTWIYTGEYGGLNEADKDRVQELYDPPYSVTVKITTAKGDAGGNVKIDGEPYWRNISSSGYSDSWRPSTFPHQAEVQNGQTLSIAGQNYASNLQLWYKTWTQDGSTNPHSLSAGDYTWKAYMDLQYNVTFYNSLPGASSSGVLKIAEVQQSSGYTAHVWQSSNSLLAEGVQQTIGGIQYTFSKWEDNSTTNPRTFTVTDHGSHTIYYNPKPNAPTGLYVSGDPGDQVTLNWTDNPNQYVSQYEIRRSWNKNRPYEYAGTVNRGTQFWVDPQCRITSGYSDSLVHYQVIGKFSYNGINADSDPAITSIYGVEGGDAKKAPGGTPKFAGPKPLPNDYSVANYPNPFNPTTMIVYALVEDAQVKLDIFDMSGRFVGTLVDGQRTAGDHATVWRAKDESGKSVASGTYFYRLLARPLSGNKPFVKSGKLILMK